MLPVEDLLALALHRLHRRRGASLNQAGGPVLEMALYGGQLAQRLRQIVLHGRPLTVKKVLVVGQNEGALPAIDDLLGTPALGPFQTRFARPLPAGVLVGDFSQIAMLI